jgi:hypothetical protein
MPGIDINQLWTPARGLPQAQPDQKSPVSNVRGGRYAEQYILNLIPTKHLLADEGTYFMTTNPIPGTALTGGSGANYQSFGKTYGFMYLQNNDSKSNPSAKRVYFDYLKVIIVSATASTNFHMAVIVDPIVNGGLANMTASTVVSPNSDINPTSVTTVNYAATAAPTVTAPSSVSRVVATCNMGGLALVGDEIVIMSGSPGAGAYAGLTAAQSASAGRKVSLVPPIIVGPGSNMIVYLWASSMSAFTYEFEMGWWER